MNRNQCSLCVEGYSAEIRVPKVLKCGHTFCSLCLSDFVAFVLTCPTCNTQIDEQVTNLPTNYALLNIETTTDSKTFEIQKEKLMKLATEQRDQIAKDLDVMTRIYNRFNDLSDSLTDLEEEDVQKYEKSIKEKEESLGRINLELLSCYKPEIKPTFTLNNFSTKEEFICEIVVELFKKTSIYAFQLEWYNKSIYWGKLGYKGGKLSIHAFTADQPPYPALFVPFRDLKKCMSIDNLQTFIDICGCRLVCNMLTSSEKTKTFIKLCTGEEGISLTGLAPKIRMFPHLNHGVIEIDIPDTNIKEDDYEFIRSLPSQTDETFTNVLQVRMRKGKCEIVNNPNYLSSAVTVPEEVVVASIKSEIFSNISENGVSVEDSGVLLLLPISQSFSKKTLCHQFKLALLND